jgi:flagellar motor component MotA
MLDELFAKSIVTFFIIAGALIVHTLISENLTQAKETIQEFKQTAKTITVTVKKESN